MVGKKLREEAHESNGQGPDDVMWPKKVKVMHDLNTLRAG